MEANPRRAMAAGLGPLLAEDKGASTPGTFRIFGSCAHAAVHFEGLCRFALARSSPENNFCFGAFESFFDVAGSVH